jgi:hypothetical protein
VRYIENYYAYRLERYTTLSRYSFIAKRFRYGRETILPEKMDFIRQSNSQTVRMFFTKRSFAGIKGPRLHILSIHVDPALINEYEKEGYLLGIKLSFNKNVLLGRKSVELFQSCIDGKNGSLDKKGEWVADSAFIRKTLTFGRIKFFLKSGIEKKISVIERF